MSANGQASQDSLDLLNNFWPKIMNEIENLTPNDFKNVDLPLARIKKIMKLDDEVKMISAEAPVVFAKAAEIFIQELTIRAWIHTEESKRRTLQRNDSALAISKFDQFDFLIDIVPRDEIKPPKKETSAQQSINTGINMANAMNAASATTLTDNNNVQYIFTIPNGGMQTQTGIPMQLQGLQGLQGLQNAQIIQLGQNGQNMQPTIISLVNNQ